MLQYFENWSTKLNDRNKPIEAILLLCQCQIFGDKIETVFAAA